MAEFRKLFWALGLTALLSFISSQIKGVPYAPPKFAEKLNKPISVKSLDVHQPSTYQIRSSKYIFTFNNEDRLVGITDLKGRDLFSLFSLVQAYNPQVIDSTSLVEIVRMYPTPSPRVDFVALPSMASLFSEPAREKPHVYLFLFLQVLWFDLRSRVPSSLGLSDTGEKVVPTGSKIKKNQMYGRHGHRFLPRMV